MRDDDSLGKCLIKRGLELTGIGTGVINRCALLRDQGMSPAATISIARPWLLRKMNHRSISKKLTLIRIKQLCDQTIRIRLKIDSVSSHK